jgi:hypothetical protein
MLTVKEWAMLVGIATLVLTATELTEWLADWLLR